MFARSLFAIALVCSVGCIPVEGDPGSDGDSGDPGDPGGDTLSTGDSITTDTGDDLASDGTTGDNDTGDTALVSTVPTDPVAFEAGTAVLLDSGTSVTCATGNCGTYWALAPKAYDATHQTPTQLFIYLHGCGGASEADVYAATNFDASWLGMAPGGWEGPCWDEDEFHNDRDQDHADQVIMDAIADMKTHFNIDPKRILIGGYSSGGDQAYYTAFHHAATFAGILNNNSIPAYYVDAGSAPAGYGTLVNEIANVAWKLNIVHLAHTEDLVYPIADVRAQRDMLLDAGFPLIYIERPGLHADDNTTNDRNTLVYPYLEAGWTAP